MSTFFLAIDIGASSGRHILGSFCNGKLCFEEIYRFPNGLIKRNNHLCWDIDKLFFHIIEGLKKCASLGKIPESVGIDTWGCDFVLLDKNNNRIGDAVAYRDSRTDGIPEYVESIISSEKLYEHTGIQKQNFNTIYQLVALQKQNPEIFDNATSFLTIPDYFHYLLSDIMCNEYTCASTTGLLNVESKLWDTTIFDSLNIPTRILKNITMPGTILGELSKEVADKVGFTCKVVLPCSHDTGSAVVALPTENTKNNLYISSGTWSLLGTELISPEKSMNAQQKNYTNEGGYNGLIRFLKNIMGLWMIQSIKKEIELQKGFTISFSQLDTESKATKISSVIDCNDNCFLSPSSMISIIQRKCKEQNMQIPITPGELTSVIYNSLALCYSSAIKDLESILKTKYTDLYIIGGGSKSSLLNSMTRDKTKLNVHAGPSEATAIGNCLVQMISAKVFSSLQEARSFVQTD